MSESDKCRTSDTPSATANAEFSQRLKSIRVELELSQKAMDSLLDIGRGSWQKYETGGHLPGSNVLAALTRRGFSANWILTGEGEMRLPADHPVNRPTENPNADKKLLGTRDASLLLVRLMDEENFEPDRSWSTLIVELMVDHNVSLAAARRIIQTLKDHQAESDQQAGD